MHRTIILAALLSAAPALAQPARNGNVWNGQSHEPTAGAVTGNEAAAGVAPSDAKTRQENHDLDVMGRQLTDKANRDAANSPGFPRPPNPSGR